LKKKRVAGMQSSSASIAKINDHPKHLTRRINLLAHDLEKVAYSVDLNDLDSARDLSMPQVWDCLREGEVERGSIVANGEEVTAIISHHSHEGLVTLQISIAEDDSWLEVWSASIEVK